MSVRLNLTAAAGQLMDAVICMDNSPAYDAFKEEIGAILNDFGTSGRLSGNWAIDADDLIGRSEETLKNMHKAFLIWSFAEEKTQGCDKDCCCASLVKLFYRSQEALIKELAGGDTIESTAVQEFIGSFISRIGSDSEVYLSVKKFFAGYVYGYYFNYLKESEIMARYAETLVYLGVMSKYIPQVSISDQQKILPKMAVLLQNNRFKYLSGFVPLEPVMEIIFSRIDFSPLPADITVIIKERITDYIKTNFPGDTLEGEALISADATAAFSSVFFGGYVAVSDFAQSIYNITSAGTRIFLNGDNDDTGDFDADKIASIVTPKCADSHNSFFSSDNPAVNDFRLGGDDMCYKYPIIYRDGDMFWFAPVFEDFLFPVIDEGMYMQADIPFGLFPFADEMFASNPVRKVGGLMASNVTIRRDKGGVLAQLNSLNASKELTDKVKTALMLEQTLILLSGNLSAEDYNACVKDNVFGTELYDDYIAYRMDLLAGGVLDNFTAKKSLLDKLNKAAG